MKPNESVEREQTLAAPPRWAIKPHPNKPHGKWTAQRQSIACKSNARAATRDNFGGGRPVELFARSDDVGYGWSLIHHALKKGFRIACALPQRKGLAP